MKNLFSKIALLGIGILSFQIISGQNNYLPGYIIKSEGDTLKGYIDYWPWDKNPEKISFKESLQSSIQTFSPQEIKGFNVSNEVYLSALVDVEQSPDNLNTLEENPELIINKETAFLQTLFDGKKPLYFYKNNKEKVQFYIKKGDIYELLVYKRYIEYSPTKGVAENRSFANQLVLYLADYPQVINKVRYMTYNKASFIKLFSEYYGYTGTEIVYKKKRENIKGKFGIVAGVSMSTIKFPSEHTSGLSMNKMNYSLNFTGGVSFDLLFPRTKGRWSIYNELLYTSFNVESKEDPLITAGYSYLKLYNMFRYNIPVGKSLFFMNLGLSNGFKLHSEENYDHNMKFDRNHEQGFLLGLGGKYSHYSFEIRYEKSTGPSSSAKIGSPITRCSAILGYSF